MIGGKSMAHTCASFPPKRPGWPVSLNRNQTLPSHANVDGHDPH